MNARDWVAVAVAVISVAGAVVSSVMAGRSSRANSDLARQRDREQEDRRARESAESAAARVYEPLVQSAADLRARIRNIVERDFLSYVQGDDREATYAVESTAYLFAQYLGWVEAFRIAALSANGEDGKFRFVQGRLNAVRRALATDRLKPTFKLFGTEQRGIGELMYQGGETTEKLRVVGYATFRSRLGDQDFAGWFDPIVSGVRGPLSDSRTRLAEIAKQLSTLIDLLDPAGKFSTGFDEKIEAEETASD